MAAKLIRLEADNFKRLRAVEIRPAGNGITVVAGRNGQGKSSVLDAIQAALGGKRAAPAEPVRRGEKRATVVCELDDLIVQRVFTPGGGAALTVTPRNGTKELKSPQAVLDRLYGALTFDPLQFLRMAPRDRLAAILDLGGPEVAKIEAERESLRKDRADKARDLKSAEARVGAMPSYPSAPKDLLSAAALEVMRGEAHAGQADLREAADAVTRLARDREECERRAKTFTDEAARLRAEAAKNDAWAKAALEQALTHAENEVAAEETRQKLAGTDFDARLREINGKIDGIVETNAQVTANRARDAARTEAKTIGQAVDELDRKLDALDQTRRTLLASALRAVPGMDLGPDGVLLQGLPFEQASTSEQLRAALGIGVAANSELRLLLIREGSLLDADSLAEVAQFAEEHDVQLIIERVGDPGQDVGVVIEDGSVVSTTEA
jgi:DNA repair exonuclease SbcCD ATPase subunit